MPTRAMSGSQGGAQPGSPGARAPGLLSGPGPPPTGGTAPRRAATGQFGYSRLLPAGMCDLALLMGDMTAASPGVLHPGHTKQAHGGGQGPGAAIRPPSPRPTADADRPGPRKAGARTPRSPPRVRHCRDWPRPVPGPGRHRRTPALPPRLAVGVGLRSGCALRRRRLGCLVRFPWLNVRFSAGKPQPLILTTRKKQWLFGP